MRIIDYKKIVNKIGFEEYPSIVTGNEKSLGDFIEFTQTDLDLRIYLTKVIICRCFSSTISGVLFPKDVNWFIDNFLEIFDEDLAKPWLSGTIREAIKMIRNGDTFTQGLLGTTFMFGIIEFYAKYLLGWRPEKYDFFDKINQDTFRKMYIKDAINKLRKTKTDIANSLNEIDKRNIQRLKNKGTQEERWIIPRIADRLTISRNSMLHGESHSFFSIGKYLVMIYILFHFHGLRAS